MRKAPPAAGLTLDRLNEMSDDELKTLDWKTLPFYNSRLLELHAAGELGNESDAKLPKKPILCIDQISEINEQKIVAEFTVPPDWPFDLEMDPTMLLQDQLDQLVGFWLSRKMSGIGRALSSGRSELLRPIKLEPGKKIKFELTKKKSMQQGASVVGIFNAEISDESGTFLKTDKITVGLIDKSVIDEARKSQAGITQIPESELPEEGLNIPIWGQETYVYIGESDSKSAYAQQKITNNLWPFAFHFEGDPVFPGNFGTHGIIELLKRVATREFGIANPVFDSLTSKKFSNQIFAKQNPHLIRFKLEDIRQESDGTICARGASLCLLDEEEVETPIYEFKDLCVKSGTSATENLADSTSDAAAAQVR